MHLQEGSFLSHFLIKILFKVTESFLCGKKMLQDMTKILFFVEFFFFENLEKITDTNTRLISTIMQRKITTFFKSLFYCNSPQHWNKGSNYTSITSYTDLYVPYISKIPKSSSKIFTQIWTKKNSTRYHCA